MAMTMAADDDNKEVDGDGATGDEVDDDSDAATENEVDNDGDGATGIKVDNDGNGGSGTTGSNDDDGDGRRATTTTTARRRQRRHTVNMFCICSSSGYQKGKIEDAVQELRQPPPIDHWHRNCLSLAIGLIMIFN